MIKREREVAARVQRAARFSAMTDALCDKVELALGGEAPIEARDLKQLSSILKELMVMQDILPAEERAERELRVRKLAKEIEERETEAVVVTFVGADESWQA